MDTCTKKKTAKVDHSKRRWALKGIAFPVIRPDIWWTAHGWTQDEEICGLFTHKKAKEMLDSIQNFSLDGYAYDIILIR